MVSAVAVDGNRGAGYLGTLAGAVAPGEVVDDLRLFMLVDASGYAGRQSQAEPR